MNSSTKVCITEINISALDPKQNNLATLRNIKIHTKDQNKELEDNHAYQGINST
jgi:hypothetical protein